VKAKLKKYTVEIVYKDAVEVVVEAKSKDDAERKALIDFFSDDEVLEVNVTEEIE